MVGFQCVFLTFVGRCDTLRVCSVYRTILCDENFSMHCRTCLLALMIMPDPSLRPKYPLSWPEIITSFLCFRCDAPHCPRIIVYLCVYFKDCMLLELEYV